MAWQVKQDKMTTEHIVHCLSSNIVFHLGMLTSITLMHRRPQIRVYLFVQLRNCNPILFF